MFYRGMKREEIKRLRSEGAAIAFIQVIPIDTER